MDTIKVLSYNIHKGKSSTGFKESLDLLQQNIDTLGVDLMFFQELQGRNDQINSLDKQHLKLARFFDMQMAYGRNCIRSSTDHGNALLSRYPILHYDNQDISDHRLEQRGVLHARLNMKGVLVHCFVVHLGLFKRSRQRQVQLITERINSLVKPHEPLIIAGDFNDWNDKLEPIFMYELNVSEVFSNSDERLNAGFPAMNFSLKRAREQFNTAYSIPNQDFSAMARLARVAKFRDLVKAFSFNESNQKPRTFPSVFPWLRLDRMYQRGFEVETAEVLKGRPWSKISDHSPILANLKLKN